VKTTPASNGPLYETAVDGPAVSGNSRYVPEAGVVVVGVGVGVGVVVVGVGVGVYVDPVNPLTNAASSQALLDEL